MFVVWLLVAVCFIGYVRSVSKGMQSEYKAPAPPPATKDTPARSETPPTPLEPADFSVDLAKFVRRFVENNLRRIIIGCGFFTIAFVLTMCILSSDSCVRYKLNRNRRESILLAPNDD